MAPQAYLLVVLILTVVLDLGLIYWTRRNLERRGITAQDEHAVSLFKRHSPFLTWINYARRSLLKPALPKLSSNLLRTLSKGDSSTSKFRRENAFIDSTSPKQEPAVIHLRFQISANERFQLTIEGLPDTDHARFEQPADRKSGSVSGSGGIISTLSYVDLPARADEFSLDAGLWEVLTNRITGFLATANAKLQAYAGSWLSSLGMILFGFSLVVYLATRLTQLPDFPIYFFSDEAVHTMLASDLVRDGFENYAGDFLPTFFDNAGTYRLGFTVYLHVLPTVLFEKSVFVTRATSVLVTLAGAYVLGLILRDFFKLRYWWSGVLFLSITPAWFLHSRTAFEYAMAVTLYVFFLYFYLRYRLETPRHIYAALIAGGMSFYSYSPMQLVVVVSGVLLLISDFRYHLGLLRAVETRPILLKGIGLLLLLAVPYARFVWLHPDANDAIMKAVNSYWIKPLSLFEKLKLYVLEYLSGLDPRYWFFPNEHDIVRHRMHGYGHTLFATLPFVVVGLVQMARRFRQSEYRLLLIALLAAPSGAALVNLTIHRALVMVIPLAILTSIGIDLLLGAVEGKQLTRARLSIALFAVLSLLNLSMLRDALVNGPTWYQDYGMSGMQYGASQVFGAVRDILEEDPNANIFITPEWSFSTDRVARFFLPDSAPVKFGSIRDFIDRYIPFTDLLFVVRVQDYERILQSSLFTDIVIQKIIPYPNQQPGFYFLTMRYKDSAEATFSALQEEYHVLQEAEIMLDGEAVKIRYSALDIGEVGNLFDGDPITLMRTRNANPAVIELTFEQMRTIREIHLVFGSTRTEITVSAYASDEDADPQIYSGTLSGTVAQPSGNFILENPISAKRIRLEVRDTAQGEPGHVHLWEVELR